MAFHFQGPLQASKSLMNRALLAQTFSPDLEIDGQSNCDDVRSMKLAVVSLFRKVTIDCGEAGTVFRFMGLRASREVGTFTLKGSARLMKRPHDELAFILNQLGVNIDFITDGVVIQSQGWKKPLSSVKIPRSRSSQFASGLLLSAWDLPFDLEFEFSGPSVSEGYWQMSVHIAQALGMEIRITPAKIKIPAGQKIKAQNINIEPDYSSMFAVVACALIDGTIEIQGVGERSLQPDYIFLDLIKKMGAAPILQNGVLTVQKAHQLLPIEASFRSCPDLFPVMAALCSFAEGTSVLRDAPQLALKESNRLKNTQDLLMLAGIDSVVKGEGLVVKGRGLSFAPKDFVFEPDQDHRMAMAAAVFRLREHKIQIQNTDVVGKSFPEFWSVIGL
ncbi:MAG: 3-phosphoshikimate 1-carboxyvinyltransferase [Bdellovibrio sp.]|jgi:3-phosphoshikimate 1-carboxyvinyltransferase